MLKIGYQANLHRFSLFASFATWILIIAGSLVTSTQSGLSVPDWPLSYGKIFPPMVGGVRFEHSHRMIAGLVALITFFQTFRIWKCESRRWVRKLAIASSVLVVAQALLGGLTVLLLLPPAVSVLHAFTAQTFFSLIVTISFVTSKHWWENYELSLKNASAPQGNLPAFSSIVLISCFIQLILGALKRHGVFKIHPHIFGALVVALLCWIMFAYINKVFSHKKDLYRAGLIFGFTVLLEIFLGAGALATRMMATDEWVPDLRTVLFTAAHVAVGALVLASATILFLISLGLKQRGWQET